MYDKGKKVMKKQITREQWDELADIHKAIFCNRMDNDTYIDEPPTIGDMIEFLDDDWIDYIPYTEKELDKVDNEYLCDTLWDRVIYKIANKYI